MLTATSATDSVASSSRATRPTSEAARWMGPHGPSTSLKVTLEPDLPSCAGIRPVYGRRNERSATGRRFRDS